MNIRLSYLSCLAIVALLSPSSVTNASVVDLGAAGQFALLALTGDIQDSGPTGPDADPYSVDGAIGVAAAGKKFQTSGSRSYNGPVYLHTGSTFNSSASGAQPAIMPQNAQNDAFLAQAVQDAINASNFASGLAATASYGTINDSLTITGNGNGNFVFNINQIKLTGGKALTLSGSANSTFVLNVSDALTLSPGSILLTGGLTADNVLINYTGSNTISMSGGGNASQVFGTLLAPNAHVQMTPGFVNGSIIAASITLSSGGNVIPVPEVTPNSVIFGFLGLLVAASSRRMLKIRTVASRKS